MSDRLLHAVIFDMDGLVLDSESGYRHAWHQAAAVMGHYLSDEFCLSLTGLNGKAIQQRLLQHCGPQFDLQRFLRLSSECWVKHVETNGIDIKSGFHDLLAALKNFGVPYCLATNSRYDNAVYCLARAGLDGVFANIISRDHVETPKPAPDIFWHAAATLNVDIHNCLVLEDSPTGVAAATAAGAYVIAIAKNVDGLEAAHQILPDLGKVAETLEAWRI